MLREDAEFGNVLLTRYPTLSVERMDYQRAAARAARRARRAARLRRRGACACSRPISDCGRTSGGAQVKRCSGRARRRIGTAHRAHGGSERVVPVGTAAAVAPRAVPAHAGAGRRFRRHCPVLALDRLWIKPRALLSRLDVHATPLARVASDHLPLVATLSLPSTPDVPRMQRSSAGKPDEEPPRPAAPWRRSGRAARIRSGRPGTARASTSRSSREHAERVELCLFDDARPARDRSASRCASAPTRSGTATCPKRGPGMLYGYRVHGPYQPEEGHRFNPHKLLLDPYAQSDRRRRCAGATRSSATRIGHKRDGPLVRPARQRRAACRSAG